MRRTKQTDPLLRTVRTIVRDAMAIERIALASAEHGFVAMAVSRREWSEEQWVRAVSILARWCLR